MEKSIIYLQGGEEEVYHNNNKELRDIIANRLALYGIVVDIENGQIQYLGKKLPNLQCYNLYLLRHAETVGTREKRFMSDFSPNAILTEKGILDIEALSNDIKKMKFDYILYSTIPRVKQTAKIIQRCMNDDVCFIEVPWIKGIDNAGWEGKKADELLGVDNEDFFQREILHNIFAKSSNGCSWGEVLFRCIDLIEYINLHFKNKKILLVSQGSILIGTRIVLHMEKELWKNYDAETFFGLKESNVQEYGKLNCIFENSLCETIY